MRSRSARTVVLPLLLAMGVAVTQAAPVPRDRHSEPLPPGAVARLGTLRFRTPMPVEGIAFAPDGKTIAAACCAGVYLFDVASGKRLRRLPASDCPWAQRAWPVFSPDGKRLALQGTLADDPAGKEMVRVWDLIGEHKPRVYEAKHVLRVGWSAQGEPLVVCLEPGALRVRELATDRSRRFECPELPDPDKPRDATELPFPLCACTPTGQELAIRHQNSRDVHVWNTLTGRRSRLPVGDEEYLSELAFSPDGGKLVLAGRQAVLWDVKTGKPLHTLKSSGEWCCSCFLSDGKILASRDGEGISLWDAASGRQCRHLEGKHIWRSDVAISPDGKLLAACPSQGCTIRLWDLATGRMRAQSPGHCARPDHAVFSPDGRRLVTRSGWDGSQCLWDARTATHLLDLHPVSAREAHAVAYSADGRWLFSARDSKLWVLDAATGEHRHTLVLQERDDSGIRPTIRSLHLSDDGKTLIAVSHGLGGNPVYVETLIMAWDVSSRKQLFRRERPGKSVWPPLSPDAHGMAVSHGEVSPGSPVKKELVQVEDVKTGKVLLTFPALEGQLLPLAFSPDGRFLAALNREQSETKERPTRNTLRVWEVATTSEVLSLPTSSTYFAHIAFSADSRLLALATSEQEITIWGLPCGCAVRRLKGFDAQVSTLAFSPDGRQLVSGLSDSTLLVWDVKGCGTRANARLDAAALARAWADLAGPNAARALRARGALACSLTETMPLLEKLVHTAASAKLQQLVADLDSDEFAVREQAQASLENLGELAEPALRQALASQPTLEMRRRLDRLLSRLRGPVKRPEALRALRAVAVLEDVATPEACHLLEKLAGGAPEARLSRDAKAALGRLRRRAALQGPGETQP